MSSFPKVFLKRGRAGPTYGRHPWLFTNAIERIDGTPADGDSVGVFGERDDFLAWGIFNSKSDIRVRLYSWLENEPVTKDLLFKKVREAISLRKNTLKLSASGNAYRVIFSEGDGLSGLVVDSYGEYLVVQITSLALFKRKAEILEALVEYLRPKGIYFRAEKNILKAEGVVAEDEVAYGEIPSEPIQISESSIKFWVDLRLGQKTGFFTDQRDNRVLARSLAAGKSVLDLCTYTGGFAIAAAKFGATEVLGIDASEDAITAARKNAELNEVSNVKFECADLFEYLQTPERTFDMVVLDPPKFATSRGSRDKALRAYFRINLEALKAVTPGGLFVTFSCSHQIGRSDFNSMVASVFRKAGRDGQMLYQGSQPADHPISLACPETQYLKAVFCKVG